MMLPHFIFDRSPLCPQVHNTCQRAFMDFFSLLFIVANKMHTTLFYSNGCMTAKLNVTINFNALCNFIVLSDNVLLVLLGRVFRFLLLLR